MCRILTYLGKPIVVEELLYKPDNSFIQQSYNPKYMSYLLNLAGFGIAAWDHTSHNPQCPYLYKTPQLPFYDVNLRNLASKISPYCLLAHLRGVSYHEQQVVSIQNVHPFIFAQSNVVLAHNGSLSHFEIMRYDLLEYIKPEYKKQINGTTDSEWIYAVFLSQLPSPIGIYETEDIIQAVLETLKILQRVRQKRNIKINSPVNLFITNGEFIAATRFVLDYGWPDANAPPSSHSGYHSLWYTYGDSYGFYDNEYKMKESTTKKSIIIASEPLTEDTTTWLEVPEYTLIVARQFENEINITSQDINL
ncbi:class II glutamine amidotransferase [Legionella maioricensis]|uniref:Class II glutamine amidotransferase n=1 Tax=Legionella maioricensis TaxID=2896528 RepID=A0A9X2IBQ7_9GAMM|nr:class II glutamine amidotransferase [Legionella maioricensis]MCL9683632.1 class II glutamine amidotransferase [Legionella maioricensis]MCL9687654.1 class II glutamine amidotransferase [Legionella maioricensis]